MTNEANKTGTPKRKHRKLVRRSHLMTIVAAWIITVPAAALISGILFVILSSFAG